MGEWMFRSIFSSRQCRFTLGDRVPGTHWIGGWLDIRASLDDVEKKKILDHTGTQTPIPRLFCQVQEDGILLAV
jgi:hypothetical protein